MSRKNFHATTALGMCLMMAPLPAAAQSSAVGPDGEPIFVPLVQACVTAPSVGDCQQVRTVISECAEELEYTRCEILFGEADEVFEDAARFDQAQELLVQASASIAEMDFTEVEGEGSDLAEVARGDAERTLLRGDENLMAHSSPDLVDGEADEVESAETEAAAEEAAAEEGVAEAEEIETEAAEAAADTEEAGAEAPEAAAADETEAEATDRLAQALTDTETDAEEGVEQEMIETEAQAESEAGVEAEAEAEVEGGSAADAEAAAEAENESQDEAERRLREALEAQEEAEAEERTDEAIEDDAAQDDAAEGAAEVEAEVDAEADSEAEAEAESESEAEQRLREALEAQEEAEAGEATEEAAEAEGEAEVEAEAEADVEAADEAERAEADDGAERGDAERDLEEERARLRAEAEEMAEEEPELVIEEAPEEEFVAPAEEPRDLDAEEQSQLDQLMEDPEVAAAVAVLGGALAGTDGDDADDEPRTGLAAALSALQRTGRDEAADDEAEAAEEAEEVIEEDISADQVRSSREDFVSRFALDFDPQQSRQDDRRRDLERAGLAALAGLAVGMMVNRNRVVARSDERVVVLRDDGEYAVWRDDDVILRQDGTQRRIERYADGSTLSRWDRPDGSQIVTIRDATGRVLWRERILADGTSIQLVDDMREAQPVDVSVLPPPRTRELRISQRTDPELALALLREAEADARELDRVFTLRQIREIREVRELVPVLSPEPITFETNRANVRAEEAPKLAQVGRLMERLIAENPREMFLVEGHTDATGPASYNLALSDRRAESVALALTEFFDIPPENLVIQGYGERHLRIRTLAAEERNRRVAIRRISPLLGL